MGSSPTKLADQVDDKVRKQNKKTQELNAEIEKTAVNRAQDSFEWISKKILAFPQYEIYQLKALTIDKDRWVGHIYDKYDENLKHGCVVKEIIELGRKNGYLIKMRAHAGFVPITITRL